MILASLRNLSTSSAAELTITPPCGSEHAPASQALERARARRLPGGLPTSSAGRGARRPPGGKEGDRGQSVCPESYLAAGTPGGAQGAQAQPWHGACAYPWGVLKPPAPPFAWLAPPRSASAGGAQRPLQGPANRQRLKQQPLSKAVRQGNRTEGTGPFQGGPCNPTRQQQLALPLHAAPAVAHKPKAQLQRTHATNLVAAVLAGCSSALKTGLQGSPRAAAQLSMLLHSAPHSAPQTPPSQPLNLTCGLTVSMGFFLAFMMLGSVA